MDIVGITTVSGEVQCTIRVEQDETSLRAGSIDDKGLERCEGVRVALRCLDHGHDQVIGNTRFSDDNNV